MRMTWWTVVVESKLVGVIPSFTLAPRGEERSTIKRHLSLYAYEESNDVMILISSTETVKNLIRNIELEILGRSSVLQTWHWKCTSQRKQNDTHCVVMFLNGSLLCEDQVIRLGFLNC